MGTNFSSPEFRARLEEAFPPGEEIPESIAPTAYPGYETINEHFHGKRWNELSLETVALNADDICLLTGPAFHYYFPAFLLCAINDPGVPLERLIASLRSGGPTTTDRSSYTHAQKTVICDLVQWVVDSDIWSDEKELVEVLLDWNPTQ